MPDPRPQGAQHPPGGATTATAPEPSPHRLCAVVKDEHGAELFVPLFDAIPNEVVTHLKQATDDQGFVELRLALGRAPIGSVRIDLPARPRGEKVWVWVGQKEPGRVSVELDHDDVTVEAVLEFEQTDVRWREGYGPT